MRCFSGKRGGPICLSSPPPNGPHYGQQPPPHLPPRPSQVALLSLRIIHNPTHTRIRTPILTRTLTHPLTRIPILILTRIPIPIRITSILIRHTTRHITSRCTNR